MNKAAALNLKLGALALLLAVCVCCKKKKDPGKNEDPAAVFDKQGLLTNMADKVILPCYEDFKRALDSLSLSYMTFSTSQSEADLKIVKQKLHMAYLRYQRISPFGLGPGETVNVRANFNVFPCNTTQINANISNGTYNLSALSNIAAKGFPALDYLFYGKNQSEADIVQLFADNKRRTYVSDLLKDMSGMTNTVLSGWQSAYRGTFINSLGTDVGSSIGFLVNQINYELDYLKNSKLGIPLGLKSGGTVLPDNCEAYYGGQSTHYAVETLKAIENLYLGRSPAGADGKGFDDYLDHLGIQHGETSLNAAIKAQFQTAYAKLALVGNPLSQQVVSNSAVVNDAHRELVKLLVLLKTDMPSNLGVVITYQDGDGD